METCKIKLDTIFGSRDSTVSKFHITVTVTRIIKIIIIIVVLLKCTQNGPKKVSTHIGSRFYNIIN